jgi:hypothetical protein
MHRKRESRVAGRECAAIDRQTLLELVRRVDQWGGEDWEPAARREREGVWAIGGDPYRRVRLLHRLRDYAQILRPIVFARIGKALVGPGPDDKVERLVEALAALFLRDVVAGIVQRRGAAAATEFKPAVA